MKNNEVLDYIPLNSFDYVKKIISETGANGMGDIGIVMPLVMQQGQGIVDGKIANNILKELLK